MRGASGPFAAELARKTSTISVRSKLCPPGDGGETRKPSVRVNCSRRSTSCSTSCSASAGLGSVRATSTLSWMRCAMSARSATWSREGGQRLQARARALDRRCGLAELALELERGLDRLGELVVGRVRRRVARARASARPRRALRSPCCPRWRARGHGCRSPPPGASSSCFTSSRAGAGGGDRAVRGRARRRELLRRGGGTGEPAQVVQIRRPGEEAHVRVAQQRAHRAARQVLADEHELGAGGAREVPAQEAQVLGRERVGIPQDAPLPGTELVQIAGIGERRGGRGSQGFEQRGELFQARSGTDPERDGIRRDSLIRCVEMCRKDSPK